MMSNTSIFITGPFVYTDKSNWTSRVEISSCIDTTITISKISICDIEPNDQNNQCNKHYVPVNYRSSGSRVVTTVSDVVIFTKVKVLMIDISDDCIEFISVVT